MKDLVLIVFAIALLSFQAAGQCNNSDDIAALEAIYNSMGGVNWNPNNSAFAPFCSWGYYDGTGYGGSDLPWNFQEPITDISNWHGIDCNAQGRVERLVIDPQSLSYVSGVIPPEINKLTYLKVFKLWPCTLETLDYDGRMNITGTIPPEFADLIYLEEFSIGHTNIGGTIPNIFNDMTNLETVTIMKSKLSGSIPDYFFESLKNKSQLSSINLSINNLSGTLPFNITELPQTLNTINLSYNYLEGNLYPELGDLNFGFNDGLVIGYNNFTDCIPQQIQQLCPWSPALDEDCEFQISVITGGGAIDFISPHTPNSLDYNNTADFCAASINCNPGPTVTGNEDPVVGEVGPLIPIIPTIEVTLILEQIECETREIFDDRIGDQITISKNNNEVSVSLAPVNPYDQWFPIWGDNTSGGAGYFWSDGQYPVAHTYTEAGNYTLCVTIENYKKSEDGNSEQCNCKIICEDITITSTDSNNTNTDACDIADFIGVYVPISDCKTEALIIPELRDYSFNKDCQLVWTDSGRPLSLRPTPSGYLLTGAGVAGSCEFEKVNCNCTKNYVHNVSYRKHDQVFYKNRCYYAVRNTLKVRPDKNSPDGKIHWIECGY